MRIALILSINLAIAGLAVNGSFAADRDPANYVGIKACGICHNKADTGKQLDILEVRPAFQSF